MPSSPACCCRLRELACKKHPPAEERGHFQPSAEASASDSLIIINDGIHQSLETQRGRFSPAITRIESNFGFKSSREIRLKKTYDAGEQRAGRLLQRGFTADLVIGAHFHLKRHFYRQSKEI